MRRSLGLHAALVAAVLFAGLAATGTEGVVSADEGAVLAQLDVLDRTGQWTIPNPEPDVDPQMRALPLELSERTSEARWAPFAKHPVHITLLRPAWALGGQAGVLAVSIGGVVLAAASAWALAERLRPGAGPAAMWLTGIGSPLVFDGFQVVGHALAAGTLGLAVLLALRASEASSPGSRLIGAIGAGLLVALTGLIRSEGVLAGVALGAAYVVAGGLRRQPWTVFVGAVCGFAAAAVRFGEPRVVRSVLGGSPLRTISLSSSTREGFVAERWSGFRITVFDAGYGVDAGEPLLLIALVLAVGAALAWRLRRDETLFHALALASAVFATGRLLTAHFLVPGLLPALPLVAVAVALADRHSVRGWSSRTLWGAAALFVGGVVATQYSTGGTGEWGGRYFAIALPVLVACSTVVAATATEAMSAPSRRVGMACLVVVAGTLAIGAIRAAETARGASNRVAEAVIDELDRLHVDATVSTRAAVSRFAWDDVVGERRWLATSRAELGEIAERLAATGAGRVALVTSLPDEDLASISGWREESSDEVVRRTTVVLLTRAE